MSITGKLPSLHWVSSCELAAQVRLVSQFCALEKGKPRSLCVNLFGQPRACVEQAVEDLLLFWGRPGVFIESESKSFALETTATQNCRDIKASSTGVGQVEVISLVP